MQFQEITDKNKWNEFVENNETLDILHTWEWGEAKKSEGWEPYRFALVSEDEIKIASCIHIRSSRVGPFNLGKLGYIAHGPSVDFLLSENLSKDNWEIFEKGLVNWARNKRIFVIEIEPKLNIQNEEDFKKYLSKAWRVTGRHRQPKNKFFNNIARTEEEIFAGMKKKTRYNVNYAKKKGIEVVKYEIKNLNDNELDNLVDKFYDLALIMQGKAKGFPMRSKEYFRSLFEAFRNTDYLAVFEAKFGEDTIAMNISEFTKVWASSFYAGSNLKLHSNLKAPYLLRWESMLEAKRRGCKIYSFWGVDSESKIHGSYSKVKESFGGYHETYIGVIAYPVNWKYYIYSFAKIFTHLWLRLRWGF